MMKNQRPDRKQGRKLSAEKSGKSRFGFPIIFLIILLLGTPFIYTQLVLDPVLVPRITFLALVLIFLAIYLAVKVKNGRYDGAVFSSPLTWVFGGYVLLSGISVILSVNPGDGIWEFLRVCLFFMLFVSLTILLKGMKNKMRWISVLFIIFSIIALSRGLIQLVEVVSEGPLNHETSYRINSWFAHRNLFAQILLFTLPFLAMGIYSLNRILKIVAGILIAISLVIITLLLVKSVWLAVFVATILSFAMLIIFWKRFGISTLVFRRIIIYLFGGLMVVMISVAVYSRYESIETFEKQTYVLKNYRFGSAIERVHLWEKSWDMFKESPFIGIGAGNWRIYLPKYGTDDMRSAEGEIIYQRPHNDFLWVLAEKGIVAFLAYLLMFLLVLFYQFRIIREAPTRAQKVFAVFLFFFMIGYGIVANLSFPSERPVPSLLLMLVFALTLVEYQHIRPVEKSDGRKAVPILLLFTVLSGAIVSIGFIKMKEDFHTRKALTYRMNSQWGKVIEEIGKGDGFFNRLDPTATPLKWYSGLSWFNLGKQDKALADFQAAYRYNPYHMHVLNNLATEYGMKKDYKKAIGFYRETVRISPDFKDAVINLSSSLYNIGKIDSAYQVLWSHPNLKDHPNYRKVVSAIVYQKIENLKKNVDDHDVELTLTRIRNSRDWMVKVHEQAIHDGVPLDRQLFIESIYLLQNVDHTVDSTRAAELRKKYLISE